MSENERPSVLVIEDEEAIDDEGYRVFDQQRRSIMHTEPADEE